MGDVMDDEPRKPGTRKIVFEHEGVDIEYEGVCEHCGKVVKSSGVRFSEEPVCSQYGTADCIMMHVHSSEDCPYWWYRLWRAWHRHGIGRWWDNRPIRKWDRKLKREKKDPSAWAEYWSKGGK
jgi:hypothetical protein